MDIVSLKIQEALTLEFFPESIFTVTTVVGGETRLVLKKGKIFCNIDIPEKTSQTLYSY